MTKTEARAIVRAHDAIESALNGVLSKLEFVESAYADAYWAGHIRGAIGGSAYGSMPYLKALEILEGEGS